MAKFEDVFPPSSEVEVLVNNVRVKEKREHQQPPPLGQNQQNSFSGGQPPTASSTPSQPSSTMKPTLAIPNPLSVDGNLSKSNTPTSAFAAGKKFASGITFSGFGKFMGRPDTAQQQQPTPTTGKPPGTPLEKPSAGPSHPQSGASVNKDLPSVTASQKNQ
jgi:hypothetical protein